MVRGDGHVPGPQHCGCGDRDLRSGVQVHVHYTGPPDPRSEIRKREPQGTEVSLHPSSCLRGQCGMNCMDHHCFLLQRRGLGIHPFSRKSSISCVPGSQGAVVCMFECLCPSKSRC